MPDIQPPTPAALTLLVEIVGQHSVPFNHLNYDQVVAAGAELRAFLAQFVTETPFVGSRQDWFTAGFTPKHEVS